ncbi:MAG: protein kinase domain-containing protein [Actinomycetota bacterium]
MLTRDRVLAGRYRIEGEVGHGGMARVYRATDTVLGRTVAVKVLDAGHASDPAFVDRFRREARAAARLNHPNVVSVYDSGSDGPVHFIVMEFVEGRTLAEVMAQEGPLAPERAAEIARSVAEALSIAHGEGLVHRDVKPGNVMITPRGQVKVMDFGIARVTTAHTITQTSTVFGTASYLAPEQAQGLQVDGRADVYALGVVLYEMLAGRVPFVADSAVAVASKHVMEQPDPPSRWRRGAPPALEAIAMRALAKDPADRFQGAAEMAGALAAFGAGDPTTAQAAPAATAPLARTDVLPPATRRHAAPRRSRWWIAALVILILAALVALVLPSLVGGKGAGRTHGRHSGNPTHRASVRPSPTPPATSAPGTTPPPSPTPAISTVNDAVAALSSTVQQAEASGAIDKGTANDVQKGVDGALHKYGDGNLDDAIKAIQDTQDKVSQAVDHQKATAAAAAAINSGLDGLAAAMQGSPPPPEGDDHGGPGHD